MTGQYHQDAEKISGPNEIVTDPASPNSPQLSSADGSDLDDNYNLYKQHIDEEPADPQEAKRVLRKVDWRVVPLLFLIYLLQYLDKNGLNYASVYGLQKGTHLKDNEYSWLGSIFYFGYLIAQYPAGYLLQRLPLGKVLGATTLTWGIIVITTPACYNFAGIASNRFLLGFVEAVVSDDLTSTMS